MNPTRRLLAVLVAAAAMGLAIVLPAAAANANPQARIGTCTFKMSSLKALNLRHDGGIDHVFIRLDDTWYPSGNDGVPFALNQTRGPASFGMPTAGVTFDASGLPVRHLTDDFPINHSISGIIQCVTATNKVFRFDDGDAVYDMTYSVTVT
jgi:hypothetical protein